MLTVNFRRHLLTEKIRGMLTVNFRCHLLTKKIRGMLNTYQSETLEGIIDPFRKILALPNDTNGYIPVQ